MDYLVFDLLAVALPAALLLLGCRGRALPLAQVGALSTTALLWTAPWDDYLVRSHVWTYDAGRVLGRVGAVPVEEFAFVVLEVLLVAAWAVRTGGLPAPALPSDSANSDEPHTRHRGALGWAAAALVGAGLVVLGGHLRYLGLLLLWAAPPLALQHAVAGDVLARRWAARLRTAGPVALWLCVADRAALGSGIWAISPVSSTGWAVLGLPVEEALFFALTCLLVTDGLLLAADPAVRGRAAALLRTRRALRVGASGTRGRPGTRAATSHGVE